ncbi:hypothetical protein [Winogradskyella sp.]|uniref:hypothetical protein n=1 Tax=Winogradskyella sp. TaxID=1883156 RepID=UPI003F6D1F84
MKKQLLLLFACATIISCDTSDDADINVSGIDPLIGTWTLQNRLLNNETPLAIDEEVLNITDDNSLSNYKGNYELITTGSENGAFSLDTEFATITFTAENNDETTYRFYLNGITLQLFITLENGDEIMDQWVKTID